MTTNSQPELRSRDHAMPRMRAELLTESAYINALMTEGHEQFNVQLMRAETSHQLTITLNLDHQLFSISDDYGTTLDPHSTAPEFFSRLDDLQGVVFDSLFSRVRAQNLYTELTVIFRGSDNYSSRELVRDTF